MRFGKTISNKFDCFALNFRYFCKVLLRTMRDLLSVLRFLVSPASSWAVARRSTRPVAEQERGWFYPLLAVVAASAFVQMAYGASLTASLVRAVALFSALFGGSLLCPVLISLSLQRLKTDGDRPVAEWELKLFSMYNLSVLALVAIIQNLLPVELLPLYILPVYLLFAISKCAPFFGISNEEKRMLFVFGTFLIIILVPLVILLILWQFMPQEI